MLRYSKVREVNDLRRGSNEASGIDFSVPEFNQSFVWDFVGNKINRGIQIDQEKITLKSGESCCIPSGIKVNIPYGYDLVFHNRGGVGAKKNLIYGAHVVDSDYQGEIFLNLHNIGNETVTIEQNELMLVQMKI